jgi:adenylate cyclase
MSQHPLKCFSRFLWAFLIGLLPCTMQAQESVVVDSLKLLLKNETTDIGRVKRMSEISSKLNVIDANLALQYARDAYQLAGRSMEKESLSNAYHALSMAFDANNLMDSAIFYCEKSIQSDLEANDRKALARSYNSQGVNYINKGDLVNGERYILLSEGLCKEFGDSSGLSDVYTNMAFIAARQGDIAKTLQYDILTLKILENGNNYSALGRTYNNIALDYKDLGDYPEALRYADLGIEYCLKHNNKADAAAASLTKGTVYFLTGDNEASRRSILEAIRWIEELGDKTFLTEAYNNMATLMADQGKFQDAQEWLMKSLGNSKEVGDEYSIMYVLHELGTNANKMGQFDKAIQFYSDALPIAQKDSALADLEIIYSGLQQSYVGLKQFDKAYDYTLLYSEVHDKRNNEEASRQLSEIRTEFETEKKQHALDLANKDNELKSKEIGKQKIIRNTVVVGLLGALVFLIIVFFQKRRIAKEKAISESLLLNILPYETAQELKAKGSAEAQLYDEVTVLFTDFKGFTMIAEKLSPKELVAEIHHCFKAFDGIMEKYHIEKIKTIGDAYMAAGGLPVVNKANPVDVVKACLEIQAFMHDYAVQRVLQGLPVFEIRIGVHTGPVVAGIVGIKKFQYDIWGDTVNTASRMESSGVTGKVNISASTYERVSDTFKCTARGRIAAKNKGEIEMYFVEGLL